MNQASRVSSGGLGPAQQVQHQNASTFEKLDHKNHGPFQVEKVVSPLTVRLTLSCKWNIHNVFHVSLLEPY